MARRSANELVGSLGVSVSKPEFSLGVKIAAVRLFVNYKGGTSIEGGAEWVINKLISIDAKVATDIQRKDPGKTLLISSGDKAHLYWLRPGAEYNPLLKLGPAFSLKEFDKTDPNKLRMSLQPAPLDLQKILAALPPVTEPKLLAANLPQVPVKEEDKSAITRFIIDADYAEIEAYRRNDPLCLQSHYSDQAYGLLCQALAENQRRGQIMDKTLDMKSSRVDAIRFPDHWTVEVDAYEVWSRTVYDASTGVKLFELPAHGVAQTLTIKQTPHGWFITNATFH